MAIAKLVGILGLFLFVDTAYAQCYHKIGGLCKGGYASGYMSDCSTPCTVGATDTKDGQKIQATTKMERVKVASGASLAEMKDLESDNKHLSESFKQLLIGEGYIQPAMNCHPECTVSCTWVNGVCQPTTSCSVKCDF